MLTLQDEWDYLFKGGEENKKAAEKAMNVRRFFPSSLLLSHTLARGSCG